MKFQAGSEIDRQHCLAIRHEYLRCKDSFERFEGVLGELESVGHTREIAHRAYNAYSAFILHLYELMLSALARDFGNTSVLSKNNRGKVAVRREGKDEEIELSDALDLVMTGATERTVTQRLNRARLAGASGDEAVEFLTELLPVSEGFSKKFRTMRNKVAGHVTYERIQQIDLSTFYHLYDNYLYVLYESLSETWGRETDEFPDFERVTDFLSALYSAPPRRG
jgi:hypothetical protein